MDGGRETLGLQHVPRHRRRRHAQVGDVHAGRGQAGDRGPLDHPARVGRLAACDHAGAPVERRAERGGEPDRDLGRQVDVDEALDAVGPEHARLRPRFPDEALVDLGPGLDLLERIDADAREDARLRADRDLVADRRAFVDPHVVAQVALTADDRAVDEGAPAHVSPHVDDRAGDAGMVAERHSFREHAVGPDARVTRDPAVRADERGRLDSFDVVEVDAVPHPDVSAQTDAGNLERDVPVQGVEVRLPELLEIADVLPVALHDVTVDRASHLEQQRKELLGEVVRPTGGNVLEDVGLEHVDAGVDRVREDLTPARLLEEPLDAAVVVGDDDAELERVVHRLEADRDGGVVCPVRLHECTQIDVAERIARDDHEGLVEKRAREPHRPRCSERLLLDRVVDREPRRLAVAEVPADRLRHEGERDYDLLEPVAAQELENVLHARLADDRNHRLRLVRGQRSQPCPLPSRHHDRLHDVRTSLRALATYWTAAASASATPAQKIHNGHSVPSAVTRTSVRPAYSTQVASLPRKLTSKS